MLALRIQRRVRLVVFASIAALVLFSLTPVAADATPLTGVVTGTITNATTGDPVSGVRVALLSFMPGGGGSLEDTTDVNGRFEVDSVPYGNYTLGFPFLTGYSSPNVQVSVEAITPDPDLSVELTPFATGAGAISGTVQDAETSLPLSSTVFLRGFDVNYSGQSDSASSFSFTDLAAGTYTYSVSATGYVTQSESIDLNDGESAVLPVQLVPANAEITGEVVDGDGGPISGLFVQLAPSGGSAGSGTLTDSGGVYDFPAVGAGDYTVSLGGAGTSWIAQSKVGTATAHGSTDVDFTLAPRVTGSVFGFVSDADLNGITDICEIAFNAAGDIIGATSGLGDGTYEIDDLDPGTYTVAFWDCGTRSTPYATEFSGGGSALSAAATFPVTEGSDVEADAILVPGASISGHIAVQTSNGTVPLPDNRGMQATVLQNVGGTWEPYPNFSNFAGAGGVGDYTFSGLLPGSYKVGFLDSHVGPRAFSPSYWQGAATVDSATAVTVGSGDSKTGIDGLVSIPVPSSAATPVDDSGLAPGDEGAVDSDGTVTTGDTTTVDVGTTYIGEWVSVWGHSTPLEFGDWEQVRTDGTVVVTVPTSLSAGAHKLVVQTADDQVLGWNPVTVAAGTTSGGSGGSSSGGSSGASSSGGSSAAKGASSTSTRSSSTGSTPVVAPAPMTSATASPTASLPASPDAATPQAEAPHPAKTTAAAPSPVGWIIGGAIFAILLIALLFVALIRRARRA